MYRIVLLCIICVVFATACVKRVSPVDRFMEVTVQLDSYAKQIEDKQSAIRDGLNAYNQTVPSCRQFSLAFEEGYVLSGDEEAALTKHIDDEDDASCQSILSGIAEKNQEIQHITGHISMLYKQLPSPYKAAKGESHRDLCRRYLQTEHGLTRVSADSLLATTELLDNLVEGFDVWCVYAEGKFATYVARGSACISPACFETRNPDSAYHYSIAGNADTLKRRHKPNNTLLGSAPASISLK